MNSLPTFAPELQDAFDTSLDAIDFIIKNLDLPLQESSNTTATSQEEILGSKFSIPPSKKDRGKTYYVDETARFVASKPGTSFTVHLQGIKHGDFIHISVLYENEEYTHSPVQCGNPRSGHLKVFNVAPRTAGLEVCADPSKCFRGLCTTRLNNKDVVGNVCIFRFEAICLNSCSKMSPDRILLLEHYNDRNELLSKSQWSLRVCSIPKRDFDLWMKSVDPNTGEKRKSLYSKFPREKKFKLEPAEETKTLVYSSSEVCNERPPYIAGQSTSGQPEFDCIHVITDNERPSLIEEKGALVITDDERSSPIEKKEVIADSEAKKVPVLEKSTIPRNGAETADVASSRVSSVLARGSNCPLFLVEMQTMEDENLVRRLVHRLNGKVLELTLSQ